MLQSVDQFLSYIPKLIQRGLLVREYNMKELPAKASQLPAISYQKTLSYRYWLVLQRVAIPPDLRVWQQVFKFESIIYTYFKFIGMGEQSECVSADIISKDRI